MGISERRDRDRQRRIEEIIDSAKHMFLSKGFAGTTMNDIADHSELSRRTLYHYFRSKEEVSLAAAGNTLEKLLEQIEKVHTAAASGIWRLRMTLGIYREMYEIDPGGFQFIISFSESIQTLGRGNGQVVRCLGTIDRIVEAISLFIREGMEDGSVRRTADPGKTAAVLVSIVHSAIQNAATDKDVIRIATSCSANDFLAETLTVVETYISANS